MRRSSLSRIAAACLAAAAIGAVLTTSVAGVEQPHLMDRPSRDHLTAAAADSASRSLEYLRREMDRYHDRIPVSEDVSSAGNRFHARGMLPDASAPVRINGSWTENPHSGATAIRCEFSPEPGRSPFGGFYFMNGTLSGTQRAPQLNWGTVPNAGVNLQGAVALTFWARGQAGGERIEFFMGGVGRNEWGEPVAPYPDSSPRVPALGTTFLLTTSWQKFTIDLTGRDLSYVLGGFAWVASASLNPAGAVFFLDDIEYQLGPERRAQRLNEPRFLRSFTTLPRQPDILDGNADGDLDFVLRNAASSYDNALAMRAFLADGSADSLRRAALIGDAFVYAIQHDRTYNDNRACTDAVSPLSPDGARARSFYAAGDIALPPGWTPNDRVGTVPIPGFYHEATATFYEVEQQALDTGNNAWVAIALLGLYQRTGRATYLDMACRLANFVGAFRHNSGSYRGFRGGVDNPESAPALREWASSEHNIDMFALTTALFRVSGNSRWQQDAAHAREFVDAMWDSGRGCYLAGTLNPDARNATAGQLPLDVQTWSELALPKTAGRASPLDCAETYHRTADAGLTGYDFNDDKDGIWFEGWAQMAVARQHAGESALADDIRQQLQIAQQTEPFGDGYGIAAASVDGLTTGFQTAGGIAFKYFRRLHVGAVAWNVFAQLGVSPYYTHTLAVQVQGNGTVTISPGGLICASACTTAWLDGAAVTLTANGASGSAFGSWTGDCSGSTSECTLTMSTDRAVVGTFGMPPQITAQPQSQTIVSGQAATLSVAAVGDGLSFQWFRGPSGSTTNPIVGATASSYTTPPLTTSTSYWVRVANAFGTVNSVTATISISAPVSRLALGLGPYNAPDGGWMAMHGSLDGNLGLTSWHRLPWPAYNALGKGTRLAAADVDGDGLDEMVVGLDAGGGGWIAILDDASHGYALLRWIRVPWSAYNDANGEVFPAAGDLDGDGRAEIVAGLGAGGGGRFAIFEDAAAGFGFLTWREVVWPTYNAIGEGATHPAVGNIDGTGHGEIVIGLGTGSNGWMEVFTGADGGFAHRAWVQIGWQAYNASNGTTFPAVGDLDGDGRAEIVAGLGRGGGGWMEIRDDANAGHVTVTWLRTSWLAYCVENGETHPAVGNVDGDNRAEIVVGLARYDGVGGWFETLDDASAAYGHRGWRQVPWPAFNAFGGALFPAIGRFD